MSATIKAQALQVKGRKEGRIVHAGKVPGSQARLTKTFLEECAKLNAAQRKAVDTIEGPVLVIAGPGTGKTQVLALRTANILRKTQMRPSNILCLTFSTSGAKTMRERLRSIIGPDAYGVTVDTIHGFCNDLILQYPHVFEDFRALEQISEIEQLRTVRRCMKRLRAGSILGKPAFENDRASSVLKRISEMKKEDIPPEALRRLVPLFREEISKTASGKERDPASQAYRDDLRLVAQFEEFITVYEGYLAALGETHRYDYDDMILTVVEALLRHDWLLASLQERYQYFLIDEFQDINGAQNRFLDTLTTNSSFDHAPNLFTVGDDDQAIYRFQGASPKNMLSFLERFPKAAIITLTENYRSTQEVLDAAMTLIEKNEDRLVGKIPGIKKSLKSQVFPQGPSASPPTGTFGKSQVHRPRLLRYPSIGNEYAGIAEILKEAHASGTPWNDMAVLCRRNEELRQMHAALHAGGIPTVVAAKQDLLSESPVRQACALLQAIEHPLDDAVLAAVLACDVFECHPADLGRLWVAHRSANRERMPGTPSQSLREFLLRAEDASLPSSLLTARNFLERCIADKNVWTLPELVEHILKDSGLLPPQNAREADPELIATLHAFYDYVKNRVYEQKSLTLPALLADLDEYRQEKHLTLEYELPHITANGVALLTAHGAKGLEFSLVIVAHVRFRNWGNRLQGSLLSLPDHLIFSLDRETEKSAKQEDERRLFYVAMTRAKEQLILTFPETYRSGEEMRTAEVSGFIADLGETIEEVVLPPERVPAPIETLYRPEPHIDQAFREYLTERLRTFQLSVTALNAFLEDPQAFLWTHFLEQPQAKAAHLSFGSSVHEALEKRNFAWQAGELFATSDLVRTFEETMTRREVMTKHDRAHYLHAGTELLTRYGRETEHDRPIILSTERSLSAHLPFVATKSQKQEMKNDVIPLFGRVDRIDLFEKNGRRCRVIDYKTGKPQKTADAVRKEGTLFRQLVFYKLLCGLSPGFTHDATVFTLDFIGDEKSGRSLLDFEITDKDVHELTELVRSVWGKIVALDFTPL